jgi:hypothetical protein
VATALRAQLEAIRATALAQAAMADALLAATAPSPMPTETPAESKVCMHPPERRIVAARMGHLAAWVCGDCGHEGGE